VFHLRVNLIRVYDIPTIRLSDKDDLHRPRALRHGLFAGDEPGVRMGAQAPASVFSRVVVEPAYKAVSAAIERAILEGALPAGSALPTEQDLALRFGVHRSTVREAIRQVEREGLLQRGEGRRLFVCLPGMADLAPRATRLLLLQQTTFQELWELAVDIEPLAARLAAERAEPADLAQLEANLAAAAATQDDAALVALDVEFHALVGGASHNRALMLAREPLGLLYNPTLLQVFRHLPQAQGRNATAHRRIVDAIAAHDVATADEWMRKHMVDFQRGFALAGLAMGTPIAPPMALP